MTSLEMLQNALAGQPDKIPSGFKTKYQWAEEWNVKPKRALEKITAGIRAGLVERKKFRIINGALGLYPVPHYKLNLK